MTTDASKLYPDEKEMAKSLNKVFNENWKEIYDAVKPSAEKGLGEIFQNFFNSMFENSCYHDWFAK